MASFSKFVDGNGTAYNVKDAAATQAITDLTTNGLSCHEVANVNDIINIINSRGVIAGYGAHASVIMTTSTTVTLSNGTEVPAWTSMIFNGPSDSLVTGIAVDRSGVVYGLNYNTADTPAINAFPINTGAISNNMKKITNGLHTTNASSGAAFRDVIYDWFGQRLNPDGEQIATADMPLCIQYTGTTYTLDSPFNLEHNDTIYLFGNGSRESAVGVVLGATGVLRGTICVLNCTTQGSSIYGKPISAEDKNRKEETKAVSAASYTYVHMLDDAEVRLSMGPGTIVKCTMYSASVATGGTLIYDFLAYLEDMFTGKVYFKKVTDNAWTPLSEIGGYAYSPNVTVVCSTDDISTITVSLSNVTAPSNYTFITQRIS